MTDKSEFHGQIVSLVPKIAERTEPDADLIAHLKVLLTMAEAGEIIGMCNVWHKPNGHTGYATGGRHSYGTLGGLDMAHAHVVKKLIERET